MSYLNLPQPFANADECNKTVDDFNKAVAELRKRYNILNVLIVTDGYVNYETNATGEFTAYCFLGDEFHSEMMAAYALGKAQSNHRQLINETMSGTKTKADAQNR